MRGLIYGLVVAGTMDVDVAAVRYVGLTKKTLAARVAGHKDAARRGRHSNADLTAWILSHKIDGLVLEADPPNLGRAERRWIKKLREDGNDLFNITDGGETGMGEPGGDGVKIPEQDLTVAWAVVRQVLYGDLQGADGALRFKAALFVIGRGRNRGQQARPTQAPTPESALDTETEELLAQFSADELKLLSKEHAPDPNG